MFAALLFSLVAAMPLDVARMAVAEASPATTQPAAVVTVVSTTQPTAAVAGSTTQPATVVVQVDPKAVADTDSIGTVLEKTRFGQLFEGKKKVTLDEVRDPRFWLETVRDLIFAV